MGIPKFFRYISERYPMTSQLIEENKIPEFDNLYVDFNGIIHNCSHPNDNDAHFRMSEQQIFTAIFAYVDMLFGKVKPKKLFFMAVDGVAPRAKMNQQRSRRFRTAKEVKDVREAALRKGEKLPEEKAFDSNCITPGTPFMARLSEQLRYFVNKKITEDADWRNIEVVLSGHEVPGEGEHKIMEYIRLSKAQPDYNPNVRHCLYGLDADLIMLGLLSHDPHFALLREEVKFGPASRKKTTSLEQLNFYLLHLSLMREYLNLEFHDMQATLPFEYNLERVIDDFILLAVFVGNDFMPHLPDLHIHENGLERLFEVYKKVLPGLGGYLNVNGYIDMGRLQVILDEMKRWETEIFQREYADVNWFKGKQAKVVLEMEQARKRSALVLTPPQRIVFDEVKRFILSNRPSNTTGTAMESLAMPNTFPAREKKFISTLASDLNLELAWDEYDDDDQNLVVFRLPQNEEEDSDDEDPEAQEAVDRVLKKYEKAKVIDGDEDGDFDERHDRAIQEKMDDWKRSYYREKLEISYDNPEEMAKLVFRYVEGLQWVMHYYYSGVASWSWFYDYHYAPRISDLQGVDKLQFDFKLGVPFKPFEQLMGVLPEASKDHIPPAFRELMYDPNSPILDFYPEEFESDLNGKKQEWEAIVKIPFIQEDRLLNAMKSREHRLSDEERRRNSFGTSTVFSYNPDGSTFYPSSLPGFFPDLARCTCKMEPFNLPTLDGLHLVPGLCDGVFLGAEALAGFPTLQTLPHTAMLGYHGVNVHGSESKNKSMIIHVQNTFEGKKTADVARDMVGKRVFVGWPFVREAMVVAVSDSLFKFERVAFGTGKQTKVLSNPHAPQGVNYWKAKAERIEDHYSKRLGVITGTVDILVHVRPLKGLKRLDTGALVKDYEGQDKEFEQAIQMALPEVISEDPRFIEKDAPPLSEEFPSGTKVFFLGDHAYGVAGQVADTEETTMSVMLAFFINEKAEKEQFKSIVANQMGTKYFPAFKVAEMVGISGYALSKITSSFMVFSPEKHKVNLGLSLKFEAKSLKVVGYSRKNDRHWEFSEKAVQLIKDYKEAFPEVFRAIMGQNNDIPSYSSVFSGDRPDALKNVRNWLNDRGVRDLEAVSLYCDQLDKNAVTEIVKLADEITNNKQPTSIKKAIVKAIPRRAILKPSHAVYRLQNQIFALGDRVVMVQDSGSVPLGVNGTVVGINAKTLDVVWDTPFMSGSTLGDRCPMYRGSIIELNSCLNVSRPQFEVSTDPNAPPKTRQPYVERQPRIGQYPAVQPSHGQAPAAGFRPATNGRGVPPMRIMSNPNRGRGRGNSWNTPTNSHVESNGTAPNSIQTQSNQSNVVSDKPSGANGVYTPPRGGRGGGFRGGGGFTQRGAAPPAQAQPNNFGPPRGGFGGGRGRGGFNPNFNERGRGAPFRGGFRGRGRGAAPVTVTPSA